MSLNIENEETHQLAGESVQRERSVETQMQQLRAIRKRCAGLLKTGGPSAVEHGDLLYDENGLPRHITKLLSRISKSSKSPI